MKRKGFKTRKHKSNNRFGVVLLFCFILPAIAIFLGLVITENLVVPIINNTSNDMDDNDDGEISYDQNLQHDAELDSTKDKTDENTNEETNKETNKEQKHKELIEQQIDPLSVYTIQIASLSDTHNIEMLINELNQNQLPYLIYRIDESYKVYTIGLTQRHFVENLLHQVRQFYPDAYIIETHMGRKKITYPKEQNEYAGKIIANINTLIEIMKKQSEVWYEYSINKGNELDKYRALLDEQEQVLNILVNYGENYKLEDPFPKKQDFEKMIHYQQSNINQSIELLQNNQNLYKVHSLFLDSLFRTIDMIK